MAFKASENGSQYRTIHWYSAACEQNYGTECSKVSMIDRYLLVLV